MKLKEMVRCQVSVAAVVLLGTALLSCKVPHADLGKGGPSAGQRGVTTVERVVDGDTVILSDGLGPSRLVGVDAPETAQPGAPIECFGQQAAAFALRLLTPGRQVRFQVARQPVDRYGRSLVYLWLPDGRFFNAMLVRGGYARVLTIPPNTRYSGSLQGLARRAARHGRGLWACPPA